MKFCEMRAKFQEHFDSITKNATHLFEVDLDKDELWQKYLSSFPAGTNLMYRERTEHDCSCCRHFIKNVGNVVVIKDNKMISVWDFETGDKTYQPVITALSEFVHSHLVTNVFLSPCKHIGTDHNMEMINDKLIQYDHFYLELSNKFVQTGRSIPDMQGEYRDSRNVFKRSLDEITEDSIMTVLELIGQKSLYRGEEWKGVLTEFLKLKRDYIKLSASEQELFAWEKSISVGGAVSRIRNHSMGTLLINISEGMELDIAVTKYEAIVAPANYKRPKAIFTKKMLEDAKKKIEELGYMSSLARRYAHLDDITINNILFADRNVKADIGSSDIFADMEKSIAVNPKKFSKVEEISVEDFISGVLPTAKNIEILLENRLSSNMVSLIAPADKTAPSMFKWDNAFSWAYAGNIADSDIKANVKSAGGDVNGVMRFSIQWNCFDGYNDDDFDAHCIEPNGNEIYFAQKCSRFTKGQLDIDITHPDRNVPAVENITFASKDTLLNGTYKFFVDNYNHRTGKSGFKAEIEIDGQIYSFEYNRPLRTDEKVQVAEVTFNNGNFTISEKLPSSVSSREVWSLTTNQFVPVSVIMYSPNYWDEQKGIGNKHYFFMLKDCINPDTPNSFYNEFLKEELTPYRRVFEALGMKTAVQEADNQLSGVGFCSTRRNEIIVKVTGSTERIVKVKF